MSRSRIIAGIAVRQLLARPRRLVATLAGASIAVAVAVTALSMIGGLRATFTGRLLDVGAHLTVTAGDVGRRTDLLLDVGPTTGAVELGRTAKRADRVRLRNVMTVLRSLERMLGDELAAASPYLATQVLATYGTNEEVVPLRGIIAERETRLAELEQTLESGSVRRLEATRYGVLLGRRAARSLGAGTGDRIRIVSMTGDIFNAEVVGVYDLGIDSANRGGLVNLRLAQAIEHALPSEATAIALQLRRPAEAAAVARRIERLTGRAVQTWEESYTGALSSYRTLRVVLAAVAAIAVAIGGFAIASLLISAAHDERGAMAALRAAGLTRRGVLLSYLVQGAALAAGACVLGSLLGVIVMAVVASLPAGGAGELMAIERATLPLEWSLRWFAAAAAGMMAAGILGAIAPGRGAAARPSAAVLRAGA